MKAMMPQAIRFDPEKTRPHHLDDMIVQGQTEKSAVTQGNLLPLILRSFESRVGCQTWERLTNLDIYRLTMHAEGVRVSHDV